MIYIHDNFKKVIKLINFKIVIELRNLFNYNIYYIVLLNLLVKSDNKLY